MSKVSKNCGISGKNLWKNGYQGAKIESLGGAIDERLIRLIG